MSEGQQKGNLY